MPPRILPATLKQTTNNKSSNKTVFSHIQSIHNTNKAARDGITLDDNTTNGTRSNVFNPAINEIQSIDNEQFSHNDNLHSNSDSDNYADTLFTTLFDNKSNKFIEITHNISVKRREIQSDTDSDNETIDPYHTSSQSITSKPKHVLNTTNDDLPDEFVALFDVSNNKRTSIQSESINSSNPSPLCDNGEVTYDIYQRAQLLCQKELRQKQAIEKLRTSAVLVPSTQYDDDESSIDSNSDNDSIINDGGWISKSNNTTPQTNRSARSTQYSANRTSTAQHHKKLMGSDSDNDTVIRAQRQHIKKRNTLSIIGELSTASEHSDIDENSTAVSNKLSTLKPDITVRRKRRKI